MRLATIGLVLATLTATQPALSQDAEQIGLARDLMGAMKISDNFDAVVPTVFQALKPALTGGNPKAAKDFDDAMPMIAQEMSTSKSGLVDDISTIYAKAFDKSELRQMVAFYRTATGEKLARLTPVMAQQIMAAGQSFGQQVAGRLTERMREELRKRGNKI